MTSATLQHKPVSPERAAYDRVSMLLLPIVRAANRGTLQRDYGTDGIQISICQALLILQNQLFDK
jgi:hypothetical protein